MHDHGTRSWVSRRPTREFVRARRDGQTSSGLCPSSYIDIGRREGRREGREREGFSIRFSRGKEIKLTGGDGGTWRAAAGSELDTRTGGSGKVKGRGDEG